MELRQLRYFLAVVEHRHFTRAARASFVSQPALSQQIQALERELGAPLFDRLPTGVELTAAGKVLHGYAERVVREVDNARLAVEEVVGTVRGEVSIATVQAASFAVVVDAVARLQARRPEVFVRVHEARSADVIADVVAGKVNLGVAYLPIDNPAVADLPLYEEEMLLVVPEDHALAGSTCPAAMLPELPLIVPPGGYCLRDGIEQALAQSRSRPRIVAEMSAVESILEAVRAGLGVTMLPAAYLRRPVGVAGLATARIDPAPRRTVGLVRNNGRHLCLASRAFLETLTTVCAERRGEGWFSLPQEMQMAAAGGQPQAIAAGKLRKLG